MTPRTVLLCVGNPLMGDDGLGIAFMQDVREQWELEGVEIVDGGTWGLSLLPVIEDAERLLIVDAIASPGEPGTFVELPRPALPAWLSRKLSPHQVDLRDALALAEFRGKMPADIVAMGLRPASVELSTTLSSSVADGMVMLKGAVVARLRDWGHHCRRHAREAVHA